MGCEAYYDLWRAVAQAFGAEDALLMQPGARCSHTHPLPWKGDIPGHLFFYHPLQYPGGSLDGPPILVFEPGALCRLGSSEAPSPVHYEWVLTSGSNGVPNLDAALHFDFHSPEDNLAVYKQVRFTQNAQIAGTNLPASKWTFLENDQFYREGCTCYRYRLECHSDAILEDAGSIAAPAAEAMKHLILHTWPQVLRRWGGRDAMVFVCPAAWKLAEIAQTLYRAWEAGGSNGPRPPHILICGGWAFSDDMEKHERWIALVKWAEERGLGHMVTGLAPDEMYMAPDLSGGVWWDDWITTPPQTRPTDEAVAAALEYLRANWDAIAGPDLAANTWPLRFTGQKMRQLLVKADPEHKPPWGEWRSLTSDDRRLTFRAFRRAVNEAIAPVEVDHIDFRFPLERG